MSTDSADSVSDPSEHLPAVFIGIVIAEILAIAGLYWFGVHFV